MVTDVIVMPTRLCEGERKGKEACKTRDILTTAYSEHRTSESVCE